MTGTIDQIGANITKFKAMGIEQLIIQNGSLTLHLNTLRLNQVTIELQLNTNVTIILLRNPSLV